MESNEPMHVPKILLLRRGVRIKNKDGTGDEQMADTSKQSKFDEAASHLKSLTNGAIRLSLIVRFAVVAWRVAWSQFSLDLSKFDFSDLLAMILALFAVGMSVAFYFKSTDSSNQFYDNIYNFTQKTRDIRTY